MINTATLNQAQITLRVDSKLKEKTLAKVRQEGVTLKALFTMLMKAYLNNDLSLGVHSKTEEPSKYLLEAIREAEEDLKHERVSPTFDNAENAIKWLNNKDRKYENQI